MLDGVVHDGVVIGDEFREDGEQVFLGSGGAGWWFGWARNSWLKKQGIREAFAKYIGAQATIRDRTQQMKIKFVPTHFRGKEAEVRRAIMRANNLTEEQLGYVGWMKNPERWTQNQRTALMKISLKGIEAERVKRFIKEGMIVMGERLSIELLEPEPWRCACCQAYGHSAAFCKEKQTICGNCMLAHQANNCAAQGEEDLYACINCNKAKLEDNRHPAWSKKCPIYQDRKRKLMDNHPEFKYKVTPTENPKTWKLRNNYKGKRKKERGNRWQAAGEVYRRREGRKRGEQESTFGEDGMGYETEEDKVLEGGWAALLEGKGGGKGRRRDGESTITDNGGESEQWDETARIYD